MKKFHDDMMKSLQVQVAEEYGIELIDIRLRRFNYPTETSRAIFARIKSEREKKAEEYRADGELQAQNIISKADEEYRTRIAKARLDEEKIKTEADTEALRLRNDAHSQDLKFYAFLKEMEKLKSVLAENRTVLMLSTKRPLFKLLFDPPVPGGEMSVPRWARGWPGSQGEGMNPSVPGSAWDRTAVEALPLPAARGTPVTIRQAEPARQCGPRQSLGPRGCAPWQWHSFTGSLRGNEDHLLSANRYSLCAIPSD